MKEADWQRKPGNSSPPGRHTENSACAWEKSRSVPNLGAVAAVRMADGHALVDQNFGVDVFQRWPTPVVESVFFLNTLSLISNLACP